MRTLGPDRADIPRHRGSDHTKDSEQEDQSQVLPFLVKRAPEKRMFGTKPIWRDQARAKESDPSRTLVDVLENPSMGGGIRHVVDDMGAYFKEEHRDDELLASYVGHMSNRVVFKRLGYLLETLDIYAPALLQVCEAGVSSGVSRLDPSMPNVGLVAWRWNLRVNGRVQPEKAITSQMCPSRSLQAQPGEAKVAYV